MQFVDDDDDDDDDDGAGDATVHGVLRNAAARCSSEAKTWSFAIVLHARWTENGLHSFGSAD